jgi:hypothetical protein
MRPQRRACSVCLCIKRDEPGNPARVLDRRRLRFAEVFAVLAFALAVAPAGAGYNATATGTDNFVQQNPA